MEDNESLPYQSVAKKAENLQTSNNQRKKHTHPDGSRKRVIEQKYVSFEFTTREGPNNGKYV